MGIVDPGTAVANTGTGSFLITPVERPVFHPEMRTLCSAAGAPGKWMAGAGILTTGIVYQWFAREIGSGRGAGDGPGDADQSDVQKADMERLNEIASQSPVGSNGVVVLPHFAGAAAPFWNADARGIIANIGLSTTRSDMARAVLESIAMELGMNFDLLVEQCGDISEVAVAGGLTQIALFNQMQADSFDTPVRLSAVPGASAFGVMISATVNLGVYPDHLQAYQSLSGHSEEYVFPDEAGRRALQDNKDLRRELHDTLESGGIYRRMRTLRAE